MPLIERSVFQPRGPHRRRWFYDDYFDLIVWLSPADAVVGFQLCYDKSGAEHSLTWQTGDGFRHHQIDAGEANPAKNQSPILLTADRLPPHQLVERFAIASSAMDHALRRFILRQLEKIVDA